MFELIPFKIEHLEPLISQNINSNLPEWIIQGHAKDMEKTLAFSGFVNGEIQVCGGITYLWENRGHLWSIFNETSKFNFIPTFRGIKKFLDSAPYRRLEMTIPINFEQGKRRALMLGFEVEMARAKHFLPNGMDASLFVRFKNGI